jgi:cytochrome P450
MSDEQLRDEAITIFTAGHETTANALTFAWYLLSQHPATERLFHLELDDVLTGREPAGTDLAALCYTRRIVAEAMRLYPPVWVIGRRAKADFAAGEFQIKAGSVVLLSQWVMHRDARYWPAPLQFDPQRWEDEARAARPRYAYFPFSFGARQCIGEAFAWLEAVVVLAALGQRWRFTRADERPIELEPTITLRPKRPLRMVVRRR